MQEDKEAQFLKYWQEWKENGKLRERGESSHIWKISQNPQVERVYWRKDVF